jgi:hypothetical protein
VVFHTNICGKSTLLEENIMYGLSASVFAVIGVACFMIVGKDIRRFSKISLVALLVGFAFIPLALISAGSFGHKLGSVSNQPTINQIELRQIGDKLGPMARDGWNDGVWDDEDAKAVLEELQNPSNGSEMNHGW